MYEHTLVDIQLPPVSDQPRLSFRVSGSNDLVAEATTLIVGCDGMHSSVRWSLQRIARLNTVQQYIDTGYVELRIPPRSGTGDKWALDNSCLHIWPRHDFMLIALPNADGSFTATLFAPYTIFARDLHDGTSVRRFFRTHFSDALAVMDENEMVQHILTRRPSALGSVQCDPSNASAYAILLGDASHAMVPFYGQGLNCGLEDVRVFMSELDSASRDGQEHTSAVLRRALDRYTALRTDDLKAIQRLAQDNYIEMRHKGMSACVMR